jgi:stearoyl-CoA desaturase (delta-9 desaturase)
MMDNTHNDASDGPFKVNSLKIDPASDQHDGVVVWDPARSIWNATMLGVTLFVAPFYFSWSALLVCVLLLEITMCAGHSVGFHRRLIHRTFQCPKWFERFLVWCGVLVGMQGPFWVIHSHDLRDWAQRQTDCHPYLRHGQSMLKDAFWSLHCKLVLHHPPQFDPGAGIGDDPFYRFLQRTWMAQQIPIALVLYWLGGMPWLVWGIAVRVCVGVSMHWFVGYICHSHGPQSWVVNGGAVQAHNVPWAAIPSMGESWHNNHHAFPASARHGLYPGQLDLGFHFLQAMERLGLVSNIQVPALLPVRLGISPVSDDVYTSQLVHPPGQLPVSPIAKHEP